MIASPSLGDALPGALTALALALAHLLLLVPRLPEPDPDEAGAEVVAVKPRYRELATGRRSVAVAALALAAGAVSGLVPPWGRGLWWVWAGSVLALAAVDQATTFLPLRMWRWCLAEGAAALTIGLWTAGGDPRMVLRCAALGVAGAVPFWLVWRLGAGIGYGDVRLAAGAGAVGAVLGVDGWLAGLLAASLAGVGLGLVTALVRRFRPSPWGAVFGYGPALWLGPWIGLLVVA